MMFIVQRAAHREDLVECARRLHDGFAYDDDARRRLLVMWREMLDAGVAVTGVMEDAAAPPGRRILHFSISAFVSDASMRYLRRYAPPLMGLHLLQAWREGRTPLLPYERVKEFNSGVGLNMVCPYIGGVEAEPAGELARVVRARLTEFYSYFHAGYRLKECLTELSDETREAWAVGFGMRPRPESAERRAAAPLAARRRPRLLGLTAAEAGERLSPLGDILFNYRAPRFGFTRTQREALLLALTTGDTDEEIAEHLDMARATVKKVWTGAYSRVARAAGGDIFPEGAGNGDARGREKRRRLLAYLRQHPEELRPHHSMLGAAAEAPWA